MQVVSHSLEKSKSSWLAEQDVLGLRCQNSVETLAPTLYSPAGSRVGLISSPGPAEQATCHSQPHLAQVHPMRT